jgi:hypothetical protein
MKIDEKIESLKFSCPDCELPHSLATEDAVRLKSILRDYIKQGEIEHDPEKAPHLRTYMAYYNEGKKDQIETLLKGL